MSFQRHHAIVVTSWQKPLIVEAHDYAVGLGCAATSIVKSPTNVYFTFCLVPDGSSEDWPRSGEGDRQRAIFVEWLEHFRYKDGSSPFSYVEVQYGSDLGETKVVVDDKALRKMAGAVDVPTVGGSLEG